MFKTLILLAALVVSSVFASPMLGQTRLPKDFASSKSSYSESKRLYNEGVRYALAGLFAQAAQIFQQAVKLDPWDVTYMFSFLDYLFRENYGQKDIQAIISAYLNIRKEEGYEDEEEDNYLNEQLMYSFLFSKTFEEAFAIMTR